jgi:eukaryotic-like serine/threonine-protein kinase
MKRPVRLPALMQHLAVAAGGFLLAYLLVAFVVLPDDVLVGDVSVPVVVGLTQADAERRLVAMGFKVAVGEERYSADAPRSTVLSQSPVAGSTVAPGSTVTLDVSAGQQRATIPALVGLTSEDAERELRRAQLQLGRVTDQASDSARGLVLGSAPEEGLVVPRGTRVDLVVSAGPSELTMPDVVGSDLETASTLITQLGLVLGPTAYDSSTSYPRGTVVSQSPAAGSAVAAGTTVLLRLAGLP